MKIKANSQKITSIKALTDTDIELRTAFAGLIAARLIGRFTRDYSLTR